MFDLLFKNAKVVDGTNSPWYIADVGVADGKIAKIGKICESEGTKVVDAKGYVLSPGFIDSHSHSDFGILRHKLNESRILQGITTELAGDCGMSPMPVTPERRALLEKYVGFLDEGIELDWTDAAGYFDKVEKNGTSVNFAMMVGHGAIRIAAMGFDDREPTPEELDKMREYTKQSMEQGCFGLTTGFIYPPGCFSKNDEVIELCKELAPYGGFYKSHMRYEGDKVMESVEDTVEVGIQAGIPVQVVHHKITGRKNWKYKGYATLAFIERARERGIDVTVDQYPYTASATTLTSTLPQWAHEGGLEKMVERLKDAETRKKITQEMREYFESDMRVWSDVFITSVPSEKNAWVKGKNIQEIADKLGKDPFDAAIDLMIEEDGTVRQLSFGMCEEDIEMIMKKPFTMIGSDGGAQPLDTNDVPHPRNYGTFPRVISHYCRERKLFSLETAIHKMTGFPAARIGLADRGVIKTGMWADLVLFDFDKIKDTPSFTKPNAACEGIKQVYVNGVLTAEDGVHTGALAGKMLRRGQ
ncbi:MAG: D-aminoacylase [Defluviitaleaceae bacterium]|nr:D-aminoacylase [Defluviitaleaceae bacterium]